MLDLKSALSSETIDNGLLDSAGEIIQNMIEEEPDPPIDDYKDAAYVVSRYLHHLEPRAQKLEHFVTVDVIRRYLTDDSWNNQLGSDEWYQNGWNEDVQASVIQIADRILQDRRWPDVVKQGFASEDRLQFWLARRAAASLNIDAWDAVWKRLQDNPYSDDLWYSIMLKANPSNIAMIVQLAIDKLSLDQISTGAARELGLGPKYEAHRSLAQVVVGLGQYPGVGWPLIVASLKSPVIHTRNMALRTLRQWPKEVWTPEMYRALNDAKKVEPHIEVGWHIQEALDSIGTREDEQTWVKGAPRRANW
ncbi:MAG: hypothetical protein ACYDBJ_21700 [Aggregatilineales bacterium]